jgi:TonB family protein
MEHGIIGYQHEFGRFARRVAAFVCFTSLLLSAMCGLVVGLRHSPLRSRLPKVVRFGYEGPTQYVQRITLEQLVGSTETAPYGPLPVRIVSQRGGRTRTRQADRGDVVPARRGAPGPGDSDAELTMRAVRRHSNVPLVQSEELVIESLVRPIYPEEAIRRNVEGRVQIQALVDTSGTVVEVQLLASTGEELLERAAETAVWQCRFKPFEMEGIVQPVYALFRFNFRIY